MAVINTHGLKMTGLKGTSSDTKELQGYYSGSYVEVFYDLSTGKVWGKYQYSLGQTTWTKYEDADIIKCGNISKPATMQEIADMVAASVEEYNLNH